MKSEVEPDEEERCGFLFGMDRAEDRIVYDLMAVPNVSSGDRRRTFEISAASYLAAEALAEEKSLQLVGIYHSHPGSPAIPSRHDLNSAQPFFSYVILSIHGGETAAVQSWRLGMTGHFEEEILSVIEVSNMFHG